MDTAQWTQEYGIVKPMVEIAPTTCSKPVLDKKVRPQKDEALNCPRCQSTNTKFCYYNNYSLTQPRYLCKTCRRYWTEGGSFRNIPVGGGSRKNKRLTPSSSLSTTTISSGSSHKFSHLNPPSFSHFSSQNPKTREAQDLNLAFPASQDYHGVPQFLEFPKIENNISNHLNSSPASPPLSALDLLRTGISSRGLGSFIPAPMPDSNTIYKSGLPFQEFKPTVGFAVDGLGTRHGSLQENGGRVMFPLGGLKQLSSTSEVDENKVQGNSNGYWNGMLGGGSW